MNIELPDNVETAMCCRGMWSRRSQRAKAPLLGEIELGRTLENESPTRHCSASRRPVVETVDIHFRDKTTCNVLSLDRGDPLGQQQGTSIFVLDGSSSQEHRGTSRDWQGLVWIETEDDRVRPLVFSFRATSERGSQGQETSCSLVETKDRGARRLLPDVRPRGTLLDHGSSTKAAAGVRQRLYSEPPSSGYLPPSAKSSGMETEAATAPNPGLAVTSRDRGCSPGRKQRRLMSLPRPTSTDNAFVLEHLCVRNDAQRPLCDQRSSSSREEGSSALLFGVRVRGDHLLGVRQLMELDA